METWTYFRLILTLSLISTVYTGKIGGLFGYPLFGGFSPLIQTPFLNMFGSFNGLNLGLTHLHKPIGGLFGIPHLFGKHHLLHNMVGKIYAGANILHRPTGGIVVGLHGLQIGVVILSWDGRPGAYDLNHMYLGNVIPNPLGNPAVVGPLGNIIGHVVFPGSINTLRPNQHKLDPNQHSSLLIINNNSGPYTGPLDPSVPCRGDGSLCVPRG